MTDLTKSRLQPIVYVPTDEFTTSRCDFCDQTRQLRVFVHRRPRRVVSQKRVCSDCAPDPWLVGEGDGTTR